MANPYLLVIKDDPRHNLRLSTLGSLQRQRCSKGQFNVALVRRHRARNAAAYPGSGLGLAIVQAILREQHGNVRVEPQEVGTRFILEWRTV